MHGLPPNALVEKHLWIVDRFAATYAKKAPHADLKAAGRLGLCEAAQRFRPRKGAAFSTYAWNWVKGHILSELRRSHVVPVPEHTARAANKRGASIRGVVKFMGGDKAFDLPDPEPERDSAHQLEKSVDRSMQRRAVHYAIEALEDPAHRHVINRTLAGRSVEQIAKGMGLSASAVDELIEQAQTLLAGMLEG